jgi:hypothetical protein
VVLWRLVRLANEELKRFGLLNFEKTSREPLKKPMKKKTPNTNPPGPAPGLKLQRIRRANGSSNLYWRPSEALFRGEERILKMLLDFLLFPPLNGLFEDADEADLLPRKSFLVVGLEGFWIGCPNKVADKVETLVESVCADLNA